MSNSIFYARPLDSGKGWAIDEYDARGAWQHSVLIRSDGASMDKIDAGRAVSRLRREAEALGEVRSEDGAPLALNWTQVISGIRELREDRDILLKISAVVNGALNGESPLDREQRATKALYAVAEALGKPF